MVNQNIPLTSPAPLRTVERSHWTDLDDDRLLAQCHVDTYRASGPGGQKRNKTSSAVRLRHGPSGLAVIAEESRSQHENRRRALRRLRQALFLRIRNDLPFLVREHPPSPCHCPPKRRQRGEEAARFRRERGEEDVRFRRGRGVRCEASAPDPSGEERKASRAALETFAKSAGWQAVCPAGTRLALGRKDIRFWPAVGMVLDVLSAAGGSVSRTASWLAISTANLVAFLASEPKVWQEANRIRIEHGLKPLAHRGK
jgi:hypothetical protein